ncbi:LysR family transcriptional regulator [uncultured Sneathiella sp.]|jgi:LysR family nitrogen assimilation transcriptional regulator|uniref:LysR family transcriptional regulator n=1 Tax=uncultured Sneathiella sp. TaxID=879315 RepID=UPI0030D85F97|tara:strand:- start:95 stop:1063 length:969 start_codon:yes stop_codon:yes gene_type:complete
MDLRQLRYFVAIFESGTLSNAADNLRIAASALSHHLANLESELGVKLFYRKPRGMAPTAAGHRLHEHAKLILKTLAAAEADLREAGGEISGDVSIGMAYSAVKAIGVDLARRVLQDFPRLELALTESLSGTTLMNLLASDVDIALVYNPPLDPSLRTQPILEERMVLVGKREIIGEDKGPITFEELLKLPIILLRQGVSARAILDDINLLKKIEKSAKLQMNSIQAIAGSLEAGLGCVIGTKLFMQDQLAKGTVHFRPIVEPELSRTLYMCELTSRPPTFALEAVRNLALELIEEAVNDGRWEAKLVLKKRRNLRQPDRRGT